MEPKRQQIEHLRGQLAKAERARQVAEEALLQSADVLGSLVAALPVGVVSIDRGGRVVLWNRAAEAILGYTAEEMVGRPLPTAVFLAGSGENTGAAHVYLRMVTGQTIKGEEVYCRRKDASVVEVSFSGAALMDDNDRLRCAICVFEEIGQRKAIGQQLYQAQKMQAVGQLTGGMAHDFNNILGVAIGNLDLLITEIGDRPAARELAEIALNALLRGAELIRALLAFSRRQPLQPAKVEPAALLAKLTRMLSRLLGEQIHVVFKAEDGLWPALVDPAQLEASITNLAINARDAMPHGGYLTVSARNVVMDDETAPAADLPPGDYLVIEITDTGTGMPPEVKARVFEPFYTTKPVGQGTGLGLSMVYGFIKQSGGSVKIYSEVGHGTTVRLYLPRAAADVAEAASPALAPEAVVGGRETILVVEDNADVRRMVESQLTGLGYHVLIAEHGPAALAVLQSGAMVDLLFSDVVMPEGVNGFELAAAATRVRPELKVLLTSGFPDRQAPLAEDAVSVAFLPKPYRRRDLAAKVRECLDGRSAL